MRVWYSARFGFGRGLPTSLAALLLACNPNGDTGVSDTSVFAAGWIAGPGDAAVMHVTPDAATSLVLSPPDHPNAFLYHIASMPDCGAVVAGGASGHPIVVLVDDEGELLWASACSDRDAVVTTMRIDGERILLGDKRYRPRCGELACSDTVWAQHLAFDGTVLATDSPRRRLAAGEGEEVVHALGLDPAGGIVALASTLVENDGAFFVTRFPE